MSKSFAHPLIRLRGVRQNNLKNFDIALPLHQLIVVTGLSGSGKSSLAFDTLFAEGQRRYIETFSPYARQFFDRMDKPQVDSIEGIPPAIAIEQRNAVKSTRSTVGTMTETCDYMKTLWPHIAQLYCRQCGRPVRKDSPQQIWETLTTTDHGPRTTGREALSHSKLQTGNPELLITFDLALTDKLSLEESLGLVAKQGYQRLLVPSLKTPARSEGRTEGAYELNEAVAPWGETKTPAPGLEIVRIDEAVGRLKKVQPASLTVIQDRLKLVSANRPRFVEACEQAYHFGKGNLTVHVLAAFAQTLQRSNASTLQPFGISPLRFSSRFHCAQCDIEYREPSSALFSFNHPLGACPACRGFGRIISIDYDLALPDRTKTLAEGVVKPWLTGHGAESQQDLMKFCKIRKAPTDVPFERLPKKWQDWVIQGDPGYGKDADHEWPRAWYGVKGYFRWLESKAYKMHVRVLLSRYRSYTPCPDCQGKRFQPETLLYEVRNAECEVPSESDESPPAENSALRPPRSALTLADFYQLPIREALRLIEQIAARRRPGPSDPIGLVLNEVRSRLGYLAEVGLGYLTLNRPTRTLSGGETERVNLTTCLGTRLVNTLYVLDEPSVGLHPRDTERLIKILEQLRDLANTVVVVEHEANVIRAANQIVDLGPGHGEAGGQLVFQGTYDEILESEVSLTGQYLSGRKQVEIPERRPVAVAADVRRLTSTRDSKPGTRNDRQSFPTSATTRPWLTLRNASLHNLKNITVEIPLGRLVCVTGVSGSGKTTLVREVLLPALEGKLKQQNLERDASEDERDDEQEDNSPSTLNSQPSTSLSGSEDLGRAVLVDQSALGKTPRSNPAVYIGAFDEIRELFAQTDAAKQRGLNASSFSFNSPQGQCERCRGAGFEKIEMQFLSDVYIRCPDCAGRRYRKHILEVKVSRQGSVLSGSSSVAAVRKSRRDGTTNHGPRTTDKSWSIADLLEATVDEVIEFLGGFADSRPARRAGEKLKLLQEVGLGYLRLGQPINTLSGGESQRLKLVSHLAEFTEPTPYPSQEGNQPTLNPSQEGNSTRAPKSTLPSSGGARGGLVSRSPRMDRKPTLFLFDEPTTGLHFDDVRVLLKVFQRLVDAGHSVLVIEHNLDVIKCADWVIDLGPEAGGEGGEIVAHGPPEEIAACETSHTGLSLRDVLRGQSQVETKG
jgi:excinuclease ABC subunit A